MTYTIVNSEPYKSRKGELSHNHCTTIHDKKFCYDRIVTVRIDAKSGGTIDIKTPGQKGGKVLSPKELTPRMFSIFNPGISSNVLDMIEIWEDMHGVKGAERAKQNSKSAKKLQDSFDSSNPSLSTAKAHYDDICSKAVEAYQSTGNSIVSIDTSSHRSRIIEKALELVDTIIKSQNAICEKVLDLASTIEKRA